MRFSPYLKILRRAAAVILILAGPAWGQMQPEITYEYYPVTPEAGRSLYRQLFSDTPRIHEGRKVAGWTNSPIDLSYRRKEVSIGRCLVADLKITCRCEISLPRLQSDDPALNSDFNTYLALLKDHEMTHCRISALHAERLQESILALGEAPCDLLKADIKVLQDNMRRERNRDQDNFDHQTRLGGFLSRKAWLLLKDSVPPRPAARPGDRPRTAAPGPSGGGLKNLPEPAPAPEPAWTAERDPDGAWRIEISEPPPGIYKDKDGVWRNY